LKILIKNGRLIDPATDRDEVVDIFVSGSAIEKIDKGVTQTGADVEVIDATGLIVAPGLIDMHAHLREPGYEYKETTNWHLAVWEVTQPLVWPTPSR
jgi:dihydroorotase